MVFFPKGALTITTYIVAVHLVVEAGAANPRAEIAAQLDTILSGNMRQSLGAPSPLLDWAVAGDDLTGSIAPVMLPVGYRPDESPFPAWPISDCNSARARPETAP